MEYFYINKTLLIQLQNVRFFIVTMNKMIIKCFLGTLYNMVLLVDKIDNGLYISH